MKKLFAFLLCLSFLGAALTGCTGMGENSSTEEESSKSNKYVEKEKAPFPERPADVTLDENGEISVMAFGAKADGVTLDTVAFQMCADLCKESDGGTIIVPAGQYLLSSVRLYSKTTLVLEKGAEILVSPNEDDYIITRGKYDDVYDRNPVHLIGKDLDEINDPSTYMYLQGSRGFTDCVFYTRASFSVKITGEGTINGQWEKFFVTDRDDPRFYACSDATGHRWSQRVLGENGLLYYPLGFRPQMIYMYGCNNITVEGIHIVDSPFFTVHLVGSAGVTVQNVEIINEIRCINTDGINISNSSNVLVKDCYVQSGDDCVALSNDINGAVVENVTAKGATALCRIFVGIDEYYQNMLGIGSSAKENAARAKSLRNITLRNCNMTDAAFCMVYAAYGTVSDVLIENNVWNSETNETGIFLCVQADGKMRNITVDGLTGTGNGVMTAMGGADETQMSNITMRNVDLDLALHTKMFGNGMPDPVQLYSCSPWAPYNLYIRHASDVTLENIKVDYASEDFSDIEEVNNPILRPVFYNPDWRVDMNADTAFPIIDLGDVHGVTLNDIDAKGHDGAADIRLRFVTGLHDNTPLSSETINDGLYS